MHEDPEKLGWKLLQALYELGRTDVDASPAVLASWLGVPASHVQELMERLDAQGFADAQRCRLSMQGLVLAVSFDGAQKLARHLAAA